MANRFVHFELSTTNVEAAKTFYKEIFDWKFNHIKEMDYTMIDLGSKETGGGVQKLMMPGQPVGWLSYVQVASVKKTLEKATAAGATIMVPFTNVGMGALGVFVDPTGAALGIWEPGAPAKAAKKAAKKPAKKAAKKATKKAPSKATKKTAKKAKKK